MIRILSLAAALVIFAIPVEAHDYQIGSVHIERPWARATPKGAEVGGGYMKITNRGTTPDRLVGGSVAVAERMVIHAMTMDGNIMKMRALDQGLELKPGATVDLAPESLHLMFEGLREPLVQGQRIKGSLTFERAGTIEIEYAVEGMGAKSPPPEGQNSQHNH